MPLDEQTNLINEDHQTTRNRALSCVGKIPFGIILEGVLVLVCELDLALSVVIGADYVSQGHRGWGYSILGLTANTLVVLASTEGLCCVQGTFYSWSYPLWFRRLPRVFNILLMLPLSPVLPFLHWIASDFQTGIIDRDRMQRSTKIEGLEQMPKAAQDEATVVARSTFLMGFLAAWLRAAGKRQLLLVIESVAGAIDRAAPAPGQRTP